MASRALGLIEVKGYLGAVVAADAAVKAANVSLLNIETIKAGLNTVQLVGDVSEVRSAVEAAVDLIQEQPYYRASHVIPRLDEQTRLLFEEKTSQSVSEIVENEIEEGVRTIDTSIQYSPPIVNDDLKINKQLTDEETLISQEEVCKYKKEELIALKVVELRRIAYREQKVPLTKKEIKFANKKVLVEALLKIKEKE